MLCPSASMHFIRLLWFRLAIGQFSLAGAVNGPRDEFFSGSRFTQYQNIGIAGPSDSNL